MFQNMCDELKGWIGEKRSVLGNEDLGKDLRSTQALQRKHQVCWVMFIHKSSIFSKETLGMLCHTFIKSTNFAKETGMLSHVCT